MSGDTRRKLFWLSVFTVAMAQLEATVVAYLRELYYPAGSELPILVIPPRIAWIEIGRETATVLMLVGVAKLYDMRDSWRQYAAFLWAFGLWDIFYYVWLRVMLGWPATLVDWDILFLIPLPWIGPVLAPVLIALIMMVAAWLIFRLRDEDRAVRVTRLEWGITIGGALALIALFCRDGRAVLDGQLPRPFPWLVYLALLIPPILAMLSAYRRSRNAA